MAQLPTTGNPLHFLQIYDGTPAANVVEVGGIDNTRIYIVAAGGTTTPFDNLSNQAPDDAQVLNVINNSVDMVFRDGTFIVSTIQTLDAAGGTDGNNILNPAHLQFRNATVILTDVTGNQRMFADVTATDTDFILGGTGSNAGWGIFGGNGTLPRTWNLTRCRFIPASPTVAKFAFVNALTTESVFINTGFATADGTAGCYGELPFFNPSGLIFSSTTRPQTPQNREFFYCMTGGFNRNTRVLANDWALVPDLDLSSAIMPQDSACGGDGDVHQFIPNLYLPTFNGNNLIFAKRQNGAAAQFTVGTAYNPNFVDTFGTSVNTWRMFYSQGTGNNQFNVQAFPDTKSATINAGGKPTAVSSGFRYSTTAENGLLLVDFDATTSNTEGSLSLIHI